MAPDIDVEVHKAQPIGGQAIPDMRISAVLSFPDGARPATASLLHVRDAEAVVDALYAALPGATLDQVLRLMLERRASQLVVRF